MTTDAKAGEATEPAGKKAARRARAAANTVDGVPPLARLFPLGLQHVLAMYAGAVAVPLIVGGVLGYSSEDLAFLISADLFVAGIATIIQSVGFWRFGVRLPLMQGVTFAAVGPMIAIGQAQGIQAVFGATIACGLFMILVAPFFSQLLRFFPPIVTGTVILIIGLSLMRVAAGWIVDGSADGAPPVNVAFAAATLLVIILIERFAPSRMGHHRRALHRAGHTRIGDSPGALTSGRRNSDSATPPARPAFSANAIRLRPPRPLADRPSGSESAKPRAIATLAA